ncbi:MAG: YhbY family RNA-binding protein [Lachnospiraceae bacterium]|nr:YhbY family RNA-binding protein [Lachnospiraceae bacterium]
MELTSKQRAYLKSLAQKEEPCLIIGKAGCTPEVAEAAREALLARELIKANVLKNCEEEPKEIARLLAERTNATLVQVIGRKFVLFQQAKKDSKITLPKGKWE